MSRMFFNVSFSDTVNQIRRQFHVSERSCRSLNYLWSHWEQFYINRLFFLRGGFELEGNKQMFQDQL